MIPRLISPHVDPKPQPARPLKAHDDLAPVSKENGKPDTSKSFDGDSSSPGHPNNPSEAQGDSSQPKDTVQAFADYQERLMLLEQQSKKRMLAAREQQSQLASASDSSQPTDTAQAFADYQKQLMLLNHQNGERLLAARAQQSQLASASDSNPEEAHNDSRPRGLSDQNHASEAVVETAKIFDVSEEFTFMFRECHTSEVLQLIRDNWRHYSQWIDGTHMKWQSPDFLKSSAELRTSLGSRLVQSARGSLPLQETVLPMLDTELNGGGCLIPAVDIKNPSHPDWRILSNFGVIITADVHYYLRCLISIAEGAFPDVDQVVDIYEKIQARYAGSESLIRYVCSFLTNEGSYGTDICPSAAFRGRDIVLTRTKSGESASPFRWTNMNECMSMRIGIESAYPSCSYLFRCLSTPGGDPIAAKVSIASLLQAQPSSKRSLVFSATSTKRSRTSAPPKPPSC
jgi:hypothetical protein